MKALGDALGALKSGKGLKGQLLRGGLGSVAVKIGSTLLNVLLAIVLARALGVEGFGVYSFVFALITIMAIPAQMGLPNLVVRETAKAQATGDWALMKGLWRWSTLMALTMSVALMAIGALAAWAFAARLPEGGLTVFYWGLVLVPLVALGNLRGAALRGLRHVVQGQLPEFILRPAFFIMLVLGAHFGLSAQALTASDAMMLHAVASLLAFMIGAWLLLRARPHELKSAPKTTAHPNLWLKTALPFAAIAGMNQITKSTDIVMLGFLVPASDVGAYKVAVQASDLVSIGLMVASMIMAPYFARMHALGDIRKMQAVAGIAAAATTSTALIVCAFYCVFGLQLITLALGQEYHAAYAPMIILAIGQLVRSLVASAGVLLTMTGHERPAALALAWITVLNVSLNALLIPFFGIIGASVATALALTAECILLWKMARNRLLIDTTILGLASPLTKKDA